MNNEKHRIANYLAVIDSWTDQEFKEHLRINRHTASILIGIIINIYLCYFTNIMTK